MTVTARAVLSVTHRTTVLVRRVTDMDWYTYDQTPCSTERWNELALLRLDQLDAIDLATTSTSFTLFRRVI